MTPEEGPESEEVASTLDAEVGVVGVDFAALPVLVCETREVAMRDDAVVEVVAARGAAVDEAAGRPTTASR